MDISNSNQNCSSRLSCGVCMILGSKCPLYFGTTFEGPTCTTTTWPPTGTTTEIKYDPNIFVNNGGQTNG